RRATYDVVIENNGNTMAQAALVGGDPERKIDFEFDPPGFHLSPGEHTTMSLRASARRRWFGSHEPRPFELRIDESPGAGAADRRSRSRNGSKDRKAKGR